MFQTPTSSNSRVNQNKVFQSKVNCRERSLRFGKCEYTVNEITVSRNDSGSRAGRWWSGASGDERCENYEHNFSRVRLNQNTLSIMMVMVHVEAVFTIELGPRIQV